MSKQTLSGELIASEHLEQCRFVSWFRQSYRGVLIFAIPNGEARSRSAGTRLKAEGVTPGIPDLFVPAWMLWIEMKRTKGGSVSPAQREMMKYLSECGYQCIVAKGWEDAKCQVEALARLP